MQIFFWTSLFAIACVGAGMSGALGWPFELFASLLTQFATASLILAGLGRFFYKQSKMPLLLLAAGMVALVGAREQFFFADAPVKSRDLRIVWVNMGNDRDENSFARLLQLARNEQADMIIASEIPARLSKEEIFQEEKEFPWIFGKLAGARTNIMMFSRLPMEEIGSVTERWNSGFLVETKDGALVIAGVHTPTPLISKNFHRRNEIVLDITDVLNTTIANGGVGVLVGDFNAVSWSVLLRSLHDHGGTRISYGWRSSWNSPLPILGLPIDQVFVFGDARASVRVGEGIGSDHFPLIVDVELNRRATSLAK